MIQMRTACERWSAFFEVIMERIKKIIIGFVKGKNLKKQLPPMLIGVFMMGFSLSWLGMVDWGTDTFTNMNIAIANKIGLTLGTWQLIFNIVLLIAVVILGADNFGFGTIANMVLCGYLYDFFSWLWIKVLPGIVPDGFLVISTADNGRQSAVISGDFLAAKIIVMIIALALFVFFAAMYMDSGLGVSPCDALPFIAYTAIKKKISKTPLKLVRIVYDIILMLIAWAFGSKWHIVTILMAFTLGPVIEFVGKRINKWFKFDEQKI